MLNNWYFIPVSEDFSITNSHEISCDVCITVFTMNFVVELAKYLQHNILSYVCAYITSDQLDENILPCLMEKEFWYRR